MSFIHAHTRRRATRQRLQRADPFQNQRARAREWARGTVRRLIGREGGGRGVATRPGRWGLMGGAAGFSKRALESGLPL